MDVICFFVKNRYSILIGIRVSILIDVRIDILDRETNEWKLSKVAARSTRFRTKTLFGEADEIEDSSSSLSDKEAKRRTRKVWTRTRQYIIRE